MSKTFAFSVTVIESERGWGSKVDDHMICLTSQDADKFIFEFNSYNRSVSAPDWYMQAEGDPTPIELTEEEFKLLEENKRMWLSQLRK